MPGITLARAVKHIREAGVLLLYPIKNRPEIPSLWNAFFPGEVMSWDWSEEGDDRIAELWHLRTSLSTSGKVVYGKWLQNRGTLFSFELFVALLSFVSTRNVSELGLSSAALEMLHTLEDDSPLATKSLKNALDLYGAEGSAAFERAIKELWLRLLVVGYGESEEGGYPSLAVGSSRLLFEEQWEASLQLDAGTRDALVKRYIAPHSVLLRNFKRMLTSIERRNG